MVPRGEPRPPDRSMEAPKPAQSGVPAPGANLRPSPVASHDEAIRPDETDALDLLRAGSPSQRRLDVKPRHHALPLEGGRYKLDRHRLFGCRPIRPPAEIGKGDRRECRSRWAPGARSRPRTAWPARWSSRCRSLLGLGPRATKGIPLGSLTSREGRLNATRDVNCRWRAVIHDGQAPFSDAAQRYGRDCFESISAIRHVCCRDERCIDEGNQTRRKPQRAALIWKPLNSRGPFLNFVRRAPIPDPAGTRGRRLSCPGASHAQIASTGGFGDEKQL